ncbi:MAG: Tyrosine--tRNA ligase, partial [Patescibacteria group bacterium]|nr:Tyrosine--tRNA ligase [Patescibacteria group bacterium]
GKDLHIGHSKNYLLLEKFMKLGHEVIILFGDFTAMIGDPTDKGSARVSLSKKQVEENLKTWKKQINPIIPLEMFSKKAKVVKNSTWLSKLTFKDVVELSSNFTVQQMIERDMFAQRLKENKPIYLHEFMYPLMQGYDSVALDVDLEIGGTDQTFNMLAGRTLLRKIKNKEKFVITTELVVDSKTGKKMSKSEGNYVGLLESPNEMFGKIMSLGDGFIAPLLRDCTRLTLEEIKKHEDSLQNGSNPRDIKIILAEEIVSIYHGPKNAKKAKEAFVSTFSDKDIKEENFKEIKINEAEVLSEILVSEKILSSKGEFARLVKEGGVTSLISGEKVTDIRFVAKKGEKYKIGKKHFIKIV